MFYKFIISKHLTAKNHGNVLSTKKDLINLVIFKNFLFQIFYSYEMTLNLKINSTVIILCVPVWYLDRYNLMLTEKIVSNWINEHNYRGTTTGENRKEKIT